MRIASPLEQFQIISLIDLGSSGKFNISFTNSSLLVVFIFSVIALLLSLSTFRTTIVPNRWQSVVESIYEFTLDMVKENIVGERAQKFFPLVFTLFIFLLFSNLLGLIPYSFTITSHLIMTFGLALSLFLGINILGIVKHKLHFLSLFLPPGSPLYLAWFLVILEFISYSFRVISLSVRLFANMMAGHTLLKILAGFAWTMMGVASAASLLHVIPVGIIFAVVGLEFGIAILQAYVFTILTCLYINDAINLH